MKRIMERMLAWIMVLLVGIGMLCMPYAMAEATEAAQAATVAFDVSPIVTGVIVLIGAALGAVLLWLTYKFIVPLLKIPIVGTLAKWAVELAENELGNGNGKIKYDRATAYVVNMLGKINITVDEAQIKAAIISAWTALNLSQIAAKIKPVIAG